MCAAGVTVIERPAYWMVEKVVLWWTMTSAADGAAPGGRSGVVCPL
jgi:hypothetical protein